MTEQMIERAARALAGLEPDENWPTNGELGGNATGTRDEYRHGLREQAQDVLDAAMPIVETVEALMALPGRSWLFSYSKQQAIPSHFFCGRGALYWPKEILDEFGPLHVICTPEETA